MKAPVYNLEGKAVSEIDVSDAFFGRKWSADLVHQVLVAQMANARHPWAHAKGRGEVSGGGRKPWKQKHTGRARHGSIRSPIWKGGGVSHGPVKARSYEQKVNKKMLRAAFAAVLSDRLRKGELKFVDALPAHIAKTKELVKSLAVLAPKQRALLVPAPDNKMIFRASANIPRMKSVPPTSLNVYDLLRYRSILVDKDAAKTMAEHYAMR
ncbi:MAG: 50S ribosomal protein L4 [Candidatus Harrisonbacteria bacterium]|nr:50S ribosomal protein L4 [Candidatus Harrisonbacteria bacterium]